MTSGGGWLERWLALRSKRTVRRTREGGLIESLFFLIVTRASEWVRKGGLSDREFDFGIGHEVRDEFGYA